MNEGFLCAMNGIHVSRKTDPFRIFIGRLSGRVGLHNADQERIDPGLKVNPCRRPKTAPMCACGSSALQLFLSGGVLAHFRNQGGTAVFFCRP